MAGELSPDRAATDGGRPLVDEIVGRLERAIFTGEFKPGQKLSEQGLSSRLGVSRGPLREAIRTLEGRRLVERVPFAGVRVVELSVEEIEQLLSTREALEGMASRQAAENMTLHETRRLRACVAETRVRFVEGGTPSVLWADGLDHDFHAQIAQGSRNRWIADLLCRDLYPLIRICRSQTTALATATRERAEAVFSEHDAITDAIERRDAEGAECLMRAHLQASRTNLMARLQLSERVQRPQARMRAAAAKGAGDPGLAGGLWRR